MYTATLVLGGVRSSQRVTVRGDPLMTLTAAQYREREAYLSELAAALARLQQLSSQASDQPDLAQRVRRIQRQVQGLYSELNGRGVRQGSLHPPTDTQWRRWQQIRRELEQLEQQMPPR